MSQLVMPLEEFLLWRGQVLVHFLRDTAVECHQLLLHSIGRGQSDNREVRAIVGTGAGSLIKVNHQAFIANGHLFLELQLLL